MTRFLCCRMKVSFSWLFLAIFCLQGLHTSIVAGNSSHSHHSRCFKAHAAIARKAVSNDSTPAPCTTTWTEFDGILSTLPPHLAFEIRGIENCKTACIRTIPGCVAVDVHPNITLCIYHLRSKSELAENRFAARLPGYKQLVLNRICSSGSKIKTETNGRLVPHSTSTGNVSESCTRQWTAISDVHSAGYHTHLGVYGEEACKKDCMENIPGCVGIEVVKQFDSCNYFIQPVEELTKTRVSQEGNTQHIITRECHSDTLTSANNLTSETNNNETDQRIQPIDRINLTLTETTIKVCTANWTKVPDVISPLYYRHTITGGREECQNACFEDINACVAISVPEIDGIPLNSTECIFYLEPLSQVISSRIPLKGYAQYVLESECLSHSWAKNNETDEFAQQNLTIADNNVTSKEECIWEEHKDVYSSGAKLYIKAINIEACKTACIHEIADCVAIDYHSSSLCWYHANNTNLDSKRQSVPGKNLIQYVRVCSLLKEEQQYSTL